MSCSALILFQEPGLRAPSFLTSRHVAQGLASYWLHRPLEVIWYKLTELASKWRLLPGYLDGCSETRFSPGDYLISQSLIKEDTIQAFLRWLCPDYFLTILLKIYVTCTAGLSHYLEKPEIPYLACTTKSRWNIWCLYGKEERKPSLSAPRHIRFKMNRGANIFLKMVISIPLNFVHSIKTERKAFLK